MWYVIRRNLGLGVDVVCCAGSRPAPQDILFEGSKADCLEFAERERDRLEDVRIWNRILFGSFVFFVGFAVIASVVFQ